MKTAIVGMGALGLLYGAHIAGQKSTEFMCPSMNFYMNG